MLLKQCDVCVTTWVDAACIETGIQLTDEERCQLIAGLLARRHLILSGPPGSRKCQLARALAQSMTGGEPGRMCALQGHPWWAGKTGDVSADASMQSAYTAWRLVFFLESAPESRESTWAGGEGKPPCGHVVCVERMSPAELDFYFGELPYRLMFDEQGRARPLAVRFIGTYDSHQPPDVNQRVLRVAALVHLDGTAKRRAGERPYSYESVSRMTNQASTVREV